MQPEVPPEVSPVGADILPNGNDHNDFLNIDQTQADAELEKYITEVFVSPEKERDRERDSNGQTFHILDSDSGSDSNETRQLKASEARLKQRIAAAGRGNRYSM